MKFILMFQVCSLIAQQCYPVMTDREPVDAWSKCVEKGANKVIELVQDDPISWDKYKFIVKYWCNEDNSNKSPTSGQPIEEKV